MRKSIILFTVLMMCLGVFAENEFSGFADTFQAASIKKGDMTGSRTRFRGKLNSYRGDNSLFVSFNAETNGLNDETDIELHEAYVEINMKDYNLRIGRQLITWGNSDGIRITDMICPLDMTEFVTQDFDDTRIPINAVNISTTKGSMELQFIGIPTFKEAEFPAQDSPWFNIPDAMKGMDMENDKPEKTIENSEAALKAAFYFSQIDFAVSGMYVWTDSPLYRIKNNKLESIYRRQKIIGIEASSTLGKFVVRNENAVHFDDYLENEEYSELIKKDIFKSLIGLDWYPGNDWTISGQFFTEMIADYSDETKNDEYESTATLNLEKKLMNQMLDISAMTYYNINKKDMYNKILIAYDFTDNISAEVGIDIFSGEEGFYSDQKDNSQVRTKLKYSF